MSIRRGIVLTMVGLLAFGAIGASAAPVVRNATVTILDAGIRPAGVSVDLNGAVTWRNAGKKAHVVVSSSNTFMPFSLRAGGSKRIVFKKKKCERYTVDAKFQGRISVAGAPCAAAGSGSTTGLDEKTFRYDITVTALVREVETWSGDPRTDGTLTRELNWTGTWRRYAVKVTTGFGFIGVQPVQGTENRGTITGRLEFSETRVSHGGACAGTIDYSGKATATLIGSRPKGSRAHFDFSANIIDNGAVDDLTLARTGAACKGNQMVLPHWQDQVNPVSLGVVIHHPPGASIHPMDTRWSAQSGVGSLPIPFSRVIAHQGFTIDSAVRTATLTQTGYVDRFTGRVKYVFKPVS
jgi:hypothetical protein